MRKLRCFKIYKLGYMMNLNYNEHSNYSILSIFHKEVKPMSIACTKSIFARISKAIISSSFYKSSIVELFTKGVSIMFTTPA